MQKRLPATSYQLPAKSNINAKSKKMIPASHCKESDSLLIR